MPRTRRSSHIRTACAILLLLRRTPAALAPPVFAPASCSSTAGRIADQLLPHIRSPIRRRSSSWPSHHRRRCPASESGGIGIGIIVGVIINSASASTAIGTVFSSSIAIQPCHRLASQRPAQHSSTPLSPALQSTLSAAPAQHSILSASIASVKPQHRVRVRSISASFQNNSIASPAQHQRSISVASAQHRRSIGAASQSQRRITLHPIAAYAPVSTAVIAPHYNSQLAPLVAALLNSALQQAAMAIPATQPAGTHTVPAAPSKPFTASKKCTWPA